MSSALSERFPHTYRMLTVRGTYVRATLGVTILLASAVVRGGVSVVILALAALIGGILAELTIGLGSDVSIRRSGIGSGRVSYYAFLIVALVPPGTDPGTVALAAATAVALGVWMSGGQRLYWVHPALVGLAVIPGIVVVSTADPLAGSAESLIAAIERSGAFRLFDAWLSGSLGLHVSPEALAALSGFGGVDPATVTAGLPLSLMLVAMLVLGEDVVPPVLPVAYLGAFVLVAEVAEVDALQLLLTGNAPVLAFLAFADPAVRPLRHGAMALFGVLAGGLAALFAVLGGVAMPAVAGLLIAGTLRPLFDLPTQRHGARRAG